LMRVSRKRSEERLIDGLDHREIGKLGEKKIVEFGRGR